MREELCRLSDEQLMGRFTGGERMALDVLMVRYDIRLLNFIHRFTGDRHAAQDLFQEAFLRVVKHAARFDTARTFSAWLYRIASNLCIDHGRRRHRGDVSLDGPLSLHGDATFHEVVPDDAPPPSARVEQQEAEVRARRLLQSLPEQQRLVLIMRHYEGLSYAEIAEVLGCSIGTVKSRIHYAFRALRKRFGQDGGMER